MKLKNLTVAMLLSTLPTAGAFAAAMDRSGQSMSAFLQPGNYFEAGISVLDADVSGKESGTSLTQRNIGDMADSYYFPSAALKLQVDNKFSFGLIYDQPFGAKAAYHGDNVFVSNPSDTVLPQATLDKLAVATIDKTFNSLTPEQRVGAALTGKGVDLTTPAGKAEYDATLNAYKNDPATQAQIDGAVKQGVTAKVNQGIADANSTLGKGNTQVEVDTQNISMIVGYQPTENWNFYAGGVYQTVKGNVSLRGQAYSLYNGYDANIKETGGGGWLVGAAYQIPDIALKASITYRSEIDHKVEIRESLPAIGAIGLLGPEAAAAAVDIANATGKTTITTPQSVNFDLQSGIMADTVAFANIRWVNWKNFSIQPLKFGLVSEAIGNLVGRPNGFDLVKYSDDQWSVTTGVGRKLTEKWAGNVSVGWDSGAGNPVTTLGPTEGFWNVGVGLQFSPTPQTFIAGGVKYFWLGDAKAQTGAQADGPEYVANFNDNTAIAYGLKLGYRF
ncbi:outer membrane protein transport protein [Acinetobacter pullicarnis]|uniref:outer membrane protein transport protein n=1 Tax=Acinetobacter pullicarnis TaxID=2576829 RepID=UPI00111E268D|nr:outer membrane protein transport protein [Acinetobacter pullicarnis]